MAHVICPECHVQFNSADSAASRICPNCGARPVPLWRRIFDRGWPLPLAIGLVLQLLAERGADGAIDGRALGLAAAISGFVAGMLVFAALAALLIFGALRAYHGWRRRAARRQRRRERDS